MEMGGYRTNVLDIFILTGIIVMNGSSARMPIAALKSISSTEMPDASSSILAARDSAVAFSLAIAHGINIGNFRMVIKYEIMFELYRVSFKR